MGDISIHGKIIGKTHEPFIIAEAGINHNGDVVLAKKMILEAKKAGADAVKFQTFSAEDFIQDKTTMYTYRSQGKEITEPMIDMFKRTEFTKEEWWQLAKFCEINDILFLSTPGNVSDLELLLSLNISAVKVGSDDFVNIPLIKRYAQENIPLLLSCGMATEKEIDSTIKASGAIDGKDVVLFLCTSQYPTPPQDVNILKLVTLKEKYPFLTLGLSDHTLGSIGAIMAVALGARVFEKHFTLDHNLPGPDHWFSEEPEALKRWITDIRIAYKMLGNSKLEPTYSEKKMRKLSHRSITASKEICEGEILGENNLIMRRPGNGLNGNYWDIVAGKRARHDILAGRQIKLEDII